MSLTSGKSVLIVDDSRELLRLLEKILENVGIITYKATSVKEAWDTLETAAPHAIITDLGMEPESGFVLLEKLRANKRYAKIPVIVLSARGEHSAVHQAFGLGVKEYVQKPLDATLILQKVKKILHSSQFSSFDFPNHQMPTLTAEVPITVSAASTSALQAEAPVRLTGDSPVQTSSALLSTMNFKGPANMRSATGVPKMNDRGAFINDLRFIGLTEAQAKALREEIRRWHTK